MPTLKQDINKIKKVLGNLYKDYEDKAVFVDFEILRWDEARLHQTLDYFIEELQKIQINEFGIVEKTAEEKQFIEWILIIFNKIKYPKTIPALIELFEKYEQFDFPNGWSSRSSLYNALMRQEAVEFLQSKVETETIEYLKENLVNFLK